VIDVRIDPGKEIRKLVRDFGKIPPELRKELRPALRKGAEPVLAEARRRAGWSTRIPKATRISAQFTKRRGGVVIAVSSRRAPHGRPYEHLGNPGTFRHPVYSGNAPTIARSRDMVFGHEIPGAFAGAYTRRRARRPQAFKGTAWVTQAARPFLFPAVEAKGDAVTRALADTVIEIGRRHGWKR
jgi:hypothetical protein